MPTETQGTRSRSGGMSVSLASPDGRVVGGGVAGLLVAASPVQVSLFMFMFQLGVVGFNWLRSSNWERMVDCPLAFTTIGTWFC